MISIKWIIVYSTLLLFLFIITLLYILGIARYVTDFEENTCEMTYMFEYPQYVVRKYFIRIFPNKDFITIYLLLYIFIKKYYKRGRERMFTFDIINSYLYLLYLKLW